MQVHGKLKSTFRQNSSTKHSKPRTQDRLEIESSNEPIISSKEHERSSPIPLFRSLITGLSILELKK